mmetsp:Transcript_26920/g.61753  ORF Transcript_26920/g.61753 Transcript_26920/m.61753 type:complete len:376 (-) Transcript_26920:939-2066(-)
MGTSPPNPPNEFPWASPPGSPNEVMGAPSPNPSNERAGVSPAGASNESLGESSPRPPNEFPSVSLPKLANELLSAPPPRSPNELPRVSPPEVSNELFGASPPIPPNELPGRSPPVAENEVPSASPPKPPNELPGASPKPPNELPIVSPPNPPNADAGAASNDESLGGGGGGTLRGPVVDDGAKVASPKLSSNPLDVTGCGSAGKGSSSSIFDLFGVPTSLPRERLAAFGGAFGGASEREKLLSVAGSATKASSLERIEILIAGLNSSPSPSPSSSLHLGSPSSLCRSIEMTDDCRPGVSSRRLDSIGSDRWLSANVSAGASLSACVGQLGPANMRMQMTARSRSLVESMTSWKVCVPSRSSSSLGACGITETVRV